MTRSNEEENSPSRIRQHSQFVHIAPKVQAAASSPHNIILQSTQKPTDRLPANHKANHKPAKKRDERSRVTHNEVERRRRDKINHWIEKLGTIIPVDGEPSGALLTNRPTMFNQNNDNAQHAADGGGAQSKGAILSKACEYVTALHHKVHT